MTRNGPFKEGDIVCLVDVGPGRITPNPVRRTINLDQPCHQLTFGLLTVYYDDDGDRKPGRIVNGRRATPIPSTGSSNGFSRVLLSRDSTLAQTERMLSARSTSVFNEEGHSMMSVP